MEELRKLESRKQEWLKLHKELTDRMHQITIAKNADYTGSTDDPFANFRRVEAMGITTTEVGFLTRMLDKMSRIASFTQNEELLVKDESVEDTLLDLANYSLLFIGYLNDRKSLNERL